MNNLKEVIIKEVENFFSDYIVKLQDNLTHYNNDFNNTIKECDELLKDELLLTIEKGGFFDFDKFYMEFEKRKDDVKEFGAFLKAYLAGEKQKKITKIVNENIQQYDWIFEDDFDLEDHLRPYILNIEKLDHLYKPVNNDPASILSGFSASISYLMDSNLQRVKHFSDTNSDFMTDYRKTYSMIGKPYHMNMESPQKTVYAQTETPGKVKLSSKKDKSNVKSNKGKQFVLEKLEFYNADQLDYDCRKFVDANIKEVSISLTGNNLNQASLYNLKLLLDGFASCKTLKLNFSATRISRELSKSIGKSLSGLKTLES